MKTWLFWDQWHIEHQDNVQVCQSKPKWIPEATYQDPGFDYLGFWPKVWRDAVSGQWRMLYFGSGAPLTLLAAESSDGIDWKPNVVCSILAGIMVSGNSSCAICPPKRKMSQWTSSTACMHSARVRPVGTKQSSAISGKRWEKTIAPPVIFAWVKWTASKTL